jgi:hypothetical protein
MGMDVHSFEELVVIGSEKERTERQEQYADARNSMPPVEAPSRILIEVAAQHPLLQSGRPAEEFVKRLQRGFELWTDLTAEGNTVEVYVPGSRHQANGVADERSLSAAGVTWLIENTRIPPAA